MLALGGIGAAVVWRFTRAQAAVAPTTSAVTAPPSAAAPPASAAAPVAPSTSAVASAAPPDTATAATAAPVPSDAASVGHPGGKLPIGKVPGHVPSTTTTAGPAAPSKVRLDSLDGSVYGGGKGK
jgi:hypothetical protein